ncbi:MAG: hypothetical protein L6V95_14800 [Candidatus Melainabacteria bacterium]|nr:MAG: hypothetical protein L6V95_14800 [Candidatus Melainabacteria bacterium]
MAFGNLFDIKSLTINQIDEIVKTARDFQLNKIKSSIAGKKCCHIF